MAGMGDSQQLWEAEQAALARGPNTPGAYDNKYGFDEYAMHEQVEFCNEVGGVMVGYAGHVPRARDKVGSCAIGNLPGTPDSINGAVGIDMETGVRVLPLDRPSKFAQKFKEGGDLPHYLSEARDPQNKAGLVRPQMFNQGTTPGYTGHVSRVKTHSLGATTHSTPAPGSSPFVGAFSPTAVFDGSKIMIKLRVNKKGHHAVSGAYKLATVDGLFDGAPQLLAAIDDAKGQILVDFSPVGGPKDYPGVSTAKGGISWPDGKVWPKWQHATVYDDGTGGM